MSIIQDSSPFSLNLTRWSRVLRDTAASQLNDILAALRARLRDRALVRVNFHYELRLDG